MLCDYVRLSNWVVPSPPRCSCIMGESGRCPRGVRYLVAPCLTFCLCWRLVWGCNTHSLNRVPWECLFVLCQGDAMFSKVELDKSVILLPTIWRPLTDLTDFDRPWRLCGSTWLCRLYKSCPRLSLARSHKFLIRQISALTPLLWAPGSQARLSLVEMGRNVFSFRAEIECVHGHSRLFSVPNLTSISEETEAGSLEEDLVLWRRNVFGPVWTDLTKFLFWAFHISSQLHQKFGVETCLNFLKETQDNDKMIN